MKQPTHQGAQDGATHPLASGAKITIYRLAFCARPFIEGRATVLERVYAMPDLYRVRFDGERQTRLRLVHPGHWQTDPQSTIHDLMTHWRASLTTETLKEPRQFPAPRPSVERNED